MNAVDLNYDHPLPVGTVLKSENDRYKFIVDHRKAPGGSDIYTVYSTGVKSEQPMEQWGSDLEQMADHDNYPEWGVEHDPHDEQ